MDCSTIRISLSGLKAAVTAAMVQMPQTAERHVRRDVPDHKDVPGKAASESVAFTLLQGSQSSTTHRNPR